MKEEWRDIKGYEGLYQVSNLGRVKRLVFINNVTKKDQCKILKLNKTKKYVIVILCKEGIVKGHYVHRLVANAFLPNPNNLPEVNHKDEDKTNNCVDNLEWCTHLYNMNYKNVKNKISNSHKGKENFKKRKPVLQYDTNMNFIKEYNGICEAHKETKIRRDSIIKCCKNKLKTGGGYIWKYKSDMKIRKRDNKDGSKKNV